MLNVYIVLDSVIITDLHYFRDRDGEGVGVLGWLVGGIVFIFKFFVNSSKTTKLHWNIREV